MKNKSTQPRAAYLFLMLALIFHWADSRAQGCVASISPAGPITICSDNSITLTANTGSAYSWTTKGMNPTIYFSVSNLPANSQVDLTIADGYIPLENLTGALLFSTDGKFMLNADGRLEHIATGYLLPNLFFPSGIQSVNISADGMVQVLISGDPVYSPIGQIYLANFANPSGLHLIGNNLYEETFNSGSAIMYSPGTGFSSWGWTIGPVTQTLEFFDSKLILDQLNLSVAGSGYFVLLNSSWEFVYTDIGKFGLNNNGQIVHEPSGYLLYPQMAIPSFIKNGIITAEGMVQVQFPGDLYYQPFGQVELAVFTDPSTLYSIGDHLFQSPESPAFSPPGSNGIGYLIHNFDITLSVTDADGCIAEDFITVSVYPSQAALAVYASGGTSFCEGSSIALDAWPGFSDYLWSNGETTQIVSAGIPGDYTVSATDASGCNITSETITVNELPLPQVSISYAEAAVLCEGGSVTLDAGAGFTDYLWSSGETTQIISTGIPGDYTVSATDASGCTGVSFPETIAVIPLPAADAGEDAAVFAGESIQIGSEAVAGNTYSWSPPEGLSDPNSANPVASPTVTTTYTLAVTDGSGCSATDEVTINVAAPGSACASAISLTPSDTCNPTGFTMSGTEMWFGFVADNPEVQVTLTNTDFTINRITVYGGGCGVLDVIEDTVPVSGMAAIDFTVNGLIPGDIYYIKTEKSLQSSSTYSICVRNLLRPNPGITINGCPFVHGNNCNTDSWSVTVCEDVPVNFCHHCHNSDYLEEDTFTYLPPCFQNVDPGDTGNTGSYFRWIFNGSNLGSTPIDDTTSFSGNQLLCHTPVWSNPGIYTVEVYFVDNKPGSLICIPGMPWIITVTVIPTPEPFTITSDNPYNAFCKGDSITLSTPGCINCFHDWYYNGSQIYPDDTAITTTQIGTYTVNIGYWETALIEPCSSDGYCSRSDTITVTESDPQVNAGSDQEKCSDTPFIIGGSPTVSDGISPYAYQWSPANGLSNSAIANPTVNLSNPFNSPINLTYSVTVTDAIGCTDNDDVSVTVNPVPIISLPAAALFCNTPNTAVTANIGGGSNFTYSWSPSAGVSPSAGTSNGGNINFTFSNTVNTNYTLTVTNNFNCSSSETISVKSSQNLVANAGADETICAGSLPATLGMISGFSCTTGWGGTPPYTYQWSMTSSPQTPASFSSTACLGTFTAGYAATYTFTVTVTDANGCTAADQKVVVVKTAEQCCTEAQFPPQAAGKYKSVSVSDNLAVVTYPDNTFFTINAGSLPSSFLVLEKVIFSYIPGGANNYSLVQKTMEFAPDARMEIKSGVKVILDRCTLKGLEDCNSMWQGVYVQGNPNLGPYQQIGTFPNIVPGQGVLVLNNSVVRDAHRGVNNYFQLNWGGVIQATGSRFINNRYAAVFLPYIGYDNLPNELYNFFRDCLFETNAPMKDAAAYGSNAGHAAFVWMWGIINMINVDCSFYFIDNTFQVTAPVPFFERGTGIQAMDSYFCVYRGGPKGGNVFKNLVTGIDVNRSAPYSFKMIPVTGNFFMDVTTGIMLTGTGGNYEIKQNSFTQNVFTGGMQPNPTIGIYDNGATLFKVFDNSFTKHTWGCYIRNSGALSSSGNYLWRNTFNNCFHAVETTGNNSSLRVLCNNFNNPAALTETYWWNSGTLQDPQGVCSNGTPPNEPAGNRFNHPVSLTRIVQSTPSAQSFTYNYDNTGGAYFPIYSFQNIAFNPILQIQCSQNSKCTGTGPQKVGRPEQQIAQQIATATDPLERMSLIAEMVELHTDKGNFDQVVSFLESVPDTEAKWMLVPEYIGKKRFTDAETMLNNLQKDNLERQKKDDYYRVHIELGKTSRKPTDMTIAEKTTVEQVALSETEVSYNAKAMLHFWFNEKYDPVLETMSSNKMAQPRTDEREIPLVVLDESTMISGIYPNPNNGVMQIDYNLTKEQKGEMIIYDVTGKKLKSFVLKNENNSLMINENIMEAGIYFYTIAVDGEILISEKLLIVE